jgi:hypothetical protein
VYDQQPSPARDQVELSPSTATASVGKRACAPKTLPVRRWQARQWQMDTRTGSAVVVTVSCPQEQAAVRSVMLHISHAVRGDLGGAHFSPKSATTPP